MKYINKMLISLYTISALAGCANIVGSGKSTNIPNTADSTQRAEAEVSPRKLTPAPLYNENAPYPEHTKNIYRNITKIEDSQGNIISKDKIKNVMDLDGKTFTDKNGNSGRITINKDTGLITMQDKNGIALEMTYIQDFSAYFRVRKKKAGSGFVYEGSPRSTSNLKNSQRDDYTRYKELPKIGRATYDGYAIGSNSEPKGEAKQIPMHGTTRLYVDFGGKTVEGVIFIPKQAAITLKKGNIASSEPYDANHCKRADCGMAKYTGEAHEKGKKVGSYDGFFYGDGASETVGNVTYDSNMDGFSFGGKKQRQNK